MRRGLLLLALLAVTACDKLKDAFTARPEVAAEAGGQVLKASRLADLMVGIKGVPQSREAADFIANMWVDHALFAEAVASGRDLRDSATAAGVMWPELSELIGTRWHDTLMALRAPATPRMADSIYDADQVRLLQHILIRVTPNAEPPERNAALKKAQGVLARVRAGTDFAKLARENSDDPGSKADGGYMPPAPRGKYVTAFDSAGWTLAPGGRTDIVETPFGYHIIRRPPVDEVRERMLAYARERVGAVLDSIYLDSLGMQRRLKVQGDAPAAMRAALADREHSLTSTRALAKYDGGALTVADFMHWVTALGPTWGNDLAGRPDSTLMTFARLIAQNHLLLQQADSAGIRPTPAEWASMMQRYHGQLDTLRMTLDLSANDLSDPATSEADRLRVAALKIEGYWDRIVSGSSRPRPIPGQLAGVLRQKAEYHVSPAGIQRAVELAIEKKAQADSASAAPRPVPPAPAPGQGGK